MQPLQRRAGIVDFLQTVTGGQRLCKHRRDAFRDRDLRHSAVHSENTPLQCGYRNSIIRGGQNRGLGGNIAQAHHGIGVALFIQLQLEGFLARKKVQQRRCVGNADCSVKVQVCRIRVKSRSTAEPV